jgi:disulfide bond formation protein DsbB
MRLITWLRSHRIVANLAGAALCLALYRYAIYAEVHLELDPCPLCLFQRYALIALGVTFMLAALLSLPRARAAGFVAVLLVTLAASAGAGVAGRHVYVQSQPPGSIPACGATLEYMMDVFPPMYVLRKVLTGSGECSKVDWTFLGISMPGWVLLWALGLGTAGAIVNWPRRRTAAG